MYAIKNYTSKKSIKEQIALHGHAGGIFNPGLFGEGPRDGTVTLEGPHYPKPHRWYGTATMKDGKIVAIK